MLPPEKIFKAYDIRGIYPDEINEQNIISIIRAIVTFLRGDNKEFKLVLGRDMRISSPSLHKVIIDTLQKLGVEVLDLGIVSTPTVYYAVLKFNAAGGLQLSASHNPKEYNGLKIIKRGDKGLIKIGKNNGMDKIKELALNDDSIMESDLPKSGQITEVDTNQLVADEVDHAMQIAGNPEIKEFKIVADAANSMGAVYLDALFKKIPGQLIKMNFDLDGTFPAHQADPLQSENLIDLQKKVIEQKADLGLAPDGDGDRMFYIDEKGQIIKSSIITALVAQELLRQESGQRIVTNTQAILNPKLVTEQYGGELVISKTGHAYITEKMTEVDAIFGGEMSGHYYFKDTGFAESQIPVVLMILKVMTRDNKKLSEIVREIKKSQESGEINFKVKNAEEVIDVLKKEFGDGVLDTLDGVTISFPEWRFNIRSSNTEPLLRLNLEEHMGKEDEARKIKIMSLINQYAEIDQEIKK